MTEEEKEKRRAAAKEPKKVFRLEEYDEEEEKGKGTKQGEWRYTVGLGKKFEYLGNGKGRSTWIPPTKGNKHKENVIQKY